MNTIGPCMNRRAFLKLPVLLPLTASGSALDAAEHRFQYECVIGTSMDVSVWTTQPGLAEHGCRTILEEIDRLALILNTRDSASEVSLWENYKGRRKLSRELAEVLDTY